MNQEGINWKLAIEVAALRKDIKQLRDELNEQKSATKQLILYLNEVRNGTIEIFKMLPTLIRRISTNFLRIMAMAKIKVEMENVAELADIFIQS